MVRGPPGKESAAREGVAPQAFVDLLSAKFAALWKRLDVAYDGWAATTDPLRRVNLRASVDDPQAGDTVWLVLPPEHLRVYA